MTTTVSTATTESQGLLPYVPRLLLRWSPTGDDPRHMRDQGHPRLRRHLRVHQAHRAARAQGQGRRRGDERHPQRDLRRRCSPRPVRRRRGPGQVGRRRRAAALPGAGPRAAGGAPAYRMRATLRTVGRLARPSRARSRCGCRWGSTAATSTSSSSATRQIHRELLDQRARRRAVTAEMEALAAAGQIGLSPATAALLAAAAGRRSRRATAGCCARQPALADVVVLPAPDVDGHRPRRTCCRRRSGRTCSPAPASPSTARSRWRSCSSPGPTTCSRARGRRRWPTALDESCATCRTPARDTASRSSRPTSTATAARSCSPPARRAAPATTRSGCCARRGSCVDRVGRLPLRIGVNRGRGLLRRLRPALPPDLLGQGRRHQPGRPGDGQGRAGPAARHPGGRRALAHRVRHRAVAAVHGQGQVAAGPRRPSVGRARRRARPRTGRTSRSSAGTRRWPSLRARAGRRARPARPAGRGRRRAGDRQVAAGRGAAAPACRRRRGRAGAVRGVRVVDAVLPVPARCSARCSACRPDAAAEAVAQRLVDRVAVNAPHLVAVAAAARASPLDLELTADRARPRELDEQFRKARLEEVVGRASSAWVLPTPTVLVVEDAHLMDDASADLLHRLARRPGRPPWLVLVTRREQRPGFVPDAERRAWSPCARRRWTRPRPSALVQSGPRGPPADRRTRWTRWPPRRRQPDVPRALVARGRPVRLGGRPARVGGGAGHQPDRPAGPGRPDRAALRRRARHGGRRGRPAQPARRPRRAADGRCARPADRVPGARASRAAAVPARADARRRLRGAAVPAPPGAARPGRARPSSGAHHAGGAVRAAVPALLPRRSVRQGLALLRARRRSALAPSSPTARPSTSSSAPRSRRRTSGDGAPAQSWPRARAAGRLPLPARSAEEAAEAYAQARRHLRGDPVRLAEHHREGGADRPAPAQVRAVDAPDHPRPARRSTASAVRGRDGPLDAGAPLRLQPLQPGPASTRRCTGPSTAATRPRRRWTRTPWPRPTRCSTRSTPARAATSRALRSAGPAGLQRARQPAAPGPLPQQPRGPGLRTRALERGAGDSRRAADASAGSATRRTRRTRSTTTADAADPPGRLDRGCAAAARGAADRPRGRGRGAGGAWRCGRPHGHSRGRAERRGDALDDARGRLEQLGALSELVDAGPRSPNAAPGRAKCCEAIERPGPPSTGLDRWARPKSSRPCTAQSGCGHPLRGELEQARITCQTAPELSARARPPSTSRGIAAGGPGSGGLARARGRHRLRTRARACSRASGSCTCRRRRRLERPDGVGDRKTRTRSRLTRRRLAGSPDVAVEQHVQ